MAQRAHKRNLIKFSHYSTALVLPKQILDQLRWQAGESVAIRFDSRRNQLVVAKDSPEDTEPKTAIESDGHGLVTQLQPTEIKPQVREIDESEAAADVPQPDNNDVLPIPEL